MELKFFSDILRLFYAEFNLNFPTNKERMVAVYIDLCVRYDCLSADFHEARLTLTTLCKELLH